MRGSTVERFAQPTATTSVGMKSRGTIVGTIAGSKFARHEAAQPSASSKQDRCAFAYRTNLFPFSPATARFFSLQPSEAEEVIARVAGRLLESYSEGGSETRVHGQLGSLRQGLKPSYRLSLSRSGSTRLMRRDTPRTTSFPTPILPVCAGTAVAYIEKSLKRCRLRLVWRFGRHLTESATAVAEAKASTSAREEIMAA